MVNYYIIVNTCKCIIDYKIKCTWIPNCYSGAYSNSNTQSLGNCPQSGYDYSAYGGFGHPSGYTPFYPAGYGGYISNSGNVNTSSASSLGISSTSSSSATTTYQLAQVPSQAGNFLIVMFKNMPQIPINV